MSNASNFHAAYGSPAPQPPQPAPPPTPLTVEQLRQSLAPIHEHIGSINGQIGAILWRIDRIEDWLAKMQRPQASAATRRRY